MSMSNATENDVLEMMLKGTDPSWRAGATTNTSPIIVAADYAYN